MEKVEFMQTMVTYLHLDDDPGTMQELNMIIDTSIQVIINGVNNKLTYDDLKNDDMFLGALRVLVTHTYYDRELLNGYSKGFISYIAPLQAKYSEVDNDETDS